MDRGVQFELLRRYEPILRFTRGEQFFPLDVAPYVAQASLWEQRPGENAVCLVDSNDLDLTWLGEVQSDGPDTVQFLKYTDPLAATALAAYYWQWRKQHPDLQDFFHTGQGRLARVGYASRFFDAIFSLALLARGRVPGDTAAAAALTYEQMTAEAKQPIYHGRVTQEAGWTVLQILVLLCLQQLAVGFCRCERPRGRLGDD